MRFLLLTPLLILGIRVPAHAASLAPGGVVAPVPGTANPSNTALTGTVLEDVSTPFANGGVPTPGQSVVNIAFRGSNAQVPSYLLNRYTAAGATIGSSPGLPPPAFTGILRTVVVRETAGGTLDFYLQLQNTSPVAATTPGYPNNIFRVSGGGFNGSGFAADALDVYYRTDGTITDVIPGTTPAAAGNSGSVTPVGADRLEANNFDPAFDFSTAVDGGFSIYPDENGGELSRFLLIRTSATVFSPSTVTVSSTGTAYVPSFAPIPEPSSVCAGLMALGAVIIHRRPTRA